jgi:signal transduction histidine kinase
VWILTSNKLCRLQVIAELKELVEQKERFLSSMTHELRTPLNGIIGLSEAMLVGSCGQLSENVMKTLTTIKNSGLRLLNLINDILDAASMRKVACSWISCSSMLLLESPVCQSHVWQCVCNCML